MEYRKGRLSIELANSYKGMYRCTFETKRKVYEGYTDDSEVYDYFHTNKLQHYYYGVTSTKQKSRELVRLAWRNAYKIAKEGRVR